jgi:hypothetical protein
MQQLRLPAFFSLIAALGFVALLNPSNAAAQLAGPLNGATYVTTVRDSSGNFTTRTVLTLHADHTMSVVAADQGGLTFFFTSQLGSWKPQGGVVGKTLDFDYPPTQTLCASITRSVSILSTIERPAPKHLLHSRYKEIPWMAEEQSWGHLLLPVNW